MPTEHPGQRLPEPIAGDAKTVSYLTGFSVRTIRRMDASGEMPRPIRKGRKVLWRLDEIRRWVEAGCPDRRDWEDCETGQARRNKS